MGVVRGTIEVGCVVTWQPLCVIASVISDNDGLKNVARLILMYEMQSAAAQTAPRCGCLIWFILLMQKEISGWRMMDLC